MLFQSTAHDTAFQAARRLAIRKASIASLDLATALHEIYKEVLAALEEYDRAKSVRDSRMDPTGTRSEGQKLTEKEQPPL